MFALGTGKKQSMWFQPKPGRRDAGANGIRFYSSQAVIYFRAAQVIVKEDFVDTSSFHALFS
jgi:hypothetical protein